MQNKKTLIIAQIFISLIMAFLMTGIFSLIELGFSNIWFYTWIRQFITAWPIAFILSFFVSNLGFKIALKITN